MPEMPDRDDRPGPNRSPGPPVRMSRGVLAWVVFILFSLMLVTMFMTSLNSRDHIRYDEFRTQLRDHNIARARIQEDSIEGDFVDPKGKTFTVDLLPGKLDLDKLVNVDFHEYCPQARV